ncbi:uncharacterized protein A4U43_C08F12160 [Asparagus officinalis]|uniref:uncharacterized protein LOC109821035 n=1 Tax=Asparagus officinalis TaxID=4686 RepID=UPI00098E6008|nr:uncharacterized protein LOC109821035 [Asparagus officinalis]ONK59905.1 uncharacterized protein A4U43_C08F12160 [Asparagus officinalis]
MALISHSSHLLLFSLLLFVSLSSPILARGHVINTSHFHRPDPLRGFKLYEGGYDVRNKHYWASAAFEGVYGFGMAGICMIGGFIVIGSYPVWRKKSVRSSPRRSLMLVLVVLVFILLMIVSSGVVLVACHNFRHRANKLEKTLMGAGGATCHALRRVMRAMDQIHVLLCPYNDPPCTLLGSSRRELRRKLVDIRMVMRTAGHLFHDALQLLFGVTVGIVCLSFALVSAAIAVLLLHWRPGLIMVIWMCWVLTTICWVLTGLDFFLHIYIKDTCSALEEFEQNPSNSSLSSLLPCPTTESADATMSELKLWIQIFVTQLNFNITKLVSIVEQESGASSRLKPKMVCDPFSNLPHYSYNASGCMNNDSIKGMLNVFMKRKQDLPKTIISNVQFFQGVLGAYSDLRRLVHCSFLKDALNNALYQQCKPLRVSTKMLFVSMICLSLCLMILIIAWMVKMLDEREASLPAKSTNLEQLEHNQL